MIAVRAAIAGLLIGHAYYHGLPWSAAVIFVLIYANSEIQTRLIWGKK